MSTMNANILNIIWVPGYILGLYSFSVSPASGSLHLTGSEFHLIDIYSLCSLSGYVLGTINTQLILEQHGCELHGSTCTWNFFFFQ